MDEPIEFLAGFPTRVLEEQPLRFQCRCSRERVDAAIVAMGRADPAVGVHEDPDADHRGDLLGAGEVARHVGPDLPRHERHDATIG